MQRSVSILASLCVLILLASIPGFASPSEMAAETKTRGDFQEIEVTTELTSYVFSEDGGALKSLYLYFTPYGTQAEELVGGTRVTGDSRLREYIPDTRFPFELALLDEAGDAPVDPEQGLTYRLLGTERPSEDRLVVTFQGEGLGLTVIKRYVVHNSPELIYMLDVEMEVVNEADVSRTLRMTVDDFDPDVKDTPAAVFMINGEPRTRPIEFDSSTTFEGVGRMNKQTVFFLKTHLLAGAVPGKEKRPSGNDQLFVDLTIPVGTSTSSLSLYGGRRRFLLMEAAGLEDLDAPGTVARLMIPVIQFLDLLYRQTGNYGWAIILFTILIRVILFPLMRKQTHSMAKMQRLQPRLKKIQARFKEDRQLLQQKMMELYKKEGVNPMGGCLPMVIQLPILILIWRAILYSAEQIHFSPGFLWLPDLSLRDPLFILVIATTLIMIVQTRLMTPMTTGETSGSQKYMGYFFPVLMAVLLWSFPAGLWLYYFLTTAFQVGQQALVNWEMARADGGSTVVSAEPEEDEEGGDEDDGEHQA